MKRQPAELEVFSGWEDLKMKADAVEVLEWERQAVLTSNSSKKVGSICPEDNLRSATSEQLSVHIKES